MDLTNISSPVHRDVDHIQPLTKTDLQDFYRSYFHPSSETRAKAAIHLIAQGSSSSTSNNVKKLTSALSQALTQLAGTTVDETALSARLEKLDLTAGSNVQGVLGAVTGYLRETAGMVEDRVKSLSEQGEGLLQQILPSLNLTSETKDSEEKTNGDAELKENGKKTVLINDVRAWKASLSASQGPRTVKDLSEFEDFEAKL